MKIILVLLALCLVTPAHSQILIEGDVTTGDGKIPELAHVHINRRGADQKQSTTYQCSKSGHFSVTIPEAGFYTLRVSAVDHQEVSIPLIFDQTDKSVSLKVRLNPNPYSNDIEKITVIGDWNKFAFASNETMTPSKTADGKTIYSYDRVATGDTLSYQVIGVAGGHSVNGTQSDYLAYDGGGDYRSVLKTKKGEKVHIIYDPAKIQIRAKDDLPEVDILNNTFIKKCYELASAVEKGQAKALEIPVGGGPATMSSKKYMAILENIKHVYADAVKDGDTRFAEFAALTLAKEFNPSTPVSPEDAAMVFRAVPTTSRMWSMSATSIMWLLSLIDKNEAGNYKEGFLHNPEPSVRAIVLADEMQKAHSSRDEKDWRRIYALLKSDYADVPEIKWQMAEHNPDAVVMVGKAIPNFEVTLLDGEGKVSNTSMLGKYYMIDFWATWCGPCVGEMPAIHKAYEKYKGKKGFEILSLSMDAAESQIKPFRTKKWKMPWMHAFLPGIFEAEIAKRFEVMGIPKPVLVGPDGRIIAMQSELRGEELEKTLGKFLGQSN